MFFIKSLLCKFSSFSKLSSSRSNCCASAHVVSYIIILLDLKSFFRFSIFCSRLTFISLTSRPNIVGKAFSNNLRLMSSSLTAVHTFSDWKSSFASSYLILECIRLSSTRNSSRDLFFDSICPISLSFSSCNFLSLNSLKSLRISLTGN